MYKCKQWYSCLYTVFQPAIPQADLLSKMFCFLYRNYVGQLPLFPSSFCLYLPQVETLRPTPPYKSLSCCWNISKDNSHLFHEHFWDCCIQASDHARGQLVMLYSAAGWFGLYLALRWLRVRHAGADAGLFLRLLLLQQPGGHHGRLLFCHAGRELLLQSKRWIVIRTR